MEDFPLCKNDEGMEFVQFTEGPTKTKQGGLQSKNRDFQPRMFSVGGERCPVALFKQFVERRPLNMRWSGPFYLGIKRNRRLNDMWFKTQPMGVNTISNMMKTTVAGTSLEESHKRFTNHSARKKNNEQAKESKRWTLRYCEDHRPPKCTIPWRLRWSRRGRTTKTLQCNIQTKLWKPQCWEKPNGSFRHHNNCCSTRSGKHERARRQTLQSVSANQLNELKKARPVKILCCS